MKRNSLKLTDLAVQDLLFSMFLRYSALIMSFLFLIMLSFITNAQTSVSGILIDAQKMTRNSQNKTITLSGKVQILFQGQHLSCDKTTIYLDNKMIEASGNVFLQNQKVNISGERLAFNYESNKGTIYQGIVQSGQVLLEGNIIEKLGDNEFVAENAYFTACTTCPPAWSFSGTKIHAELGGYAHIEYPVLSFGKIPVFLLPWIVVPLKSTRQTGLLEPKFLINDSRKLGIELRHFWAISRSQDLTSNITFFRDKTIKPFLEYRYVLNENSKGFLNTSYLRDKLFDLPVPSPDSPNEPELVRETRDRWFIDYNHYHEMPSDFIHRANLKLVSDLKYFRDFPRDIDVDGDPALENKISITQSKKDYLLTAETAYYVNQLVADPLSDNDSSVHRFPEVHFNLIEQRIFESPIFWSLDSHYVHFARKGYSYDDVVNSGEEIGDGFICPTNAERCISNERDGEFNPSKNDILRAGHRFEIKPSISAPFRVSNLLEVMPKLTFRETQYRFNAFTTETDTNYNPTAARRNIEFDISTRTRLSSVFGDPDSDIKYKHVIEPEIRYANIPWIRRPNHYFFGQFEDQPYTFSNEPLSDDDFFGTNKVQFDYEDRVFDKRIVDFGITNRLIQRRKIGDSIDYHNLGTFKLSQTYDFNEAEDENSHPWSTINALVDLRLDRFETHSTAVYYPYARVTNSSTRFKFMDLSGNFVQLAYTRRVLVTKDNNVDLSTQSNNVGLSLGWVSQYINLIGGFDYSRVTNQISSWRYDTQLKPPGNCWFIRFSQFQNPEGKPEFDFGLNFDFSGYI